MTRYEIELTGLTKSFRTVEAVRDLSFAVRSGAVTGFPAHGPAHRPRTIDGGHINEPSRYPRVPE